MPIAPTKGGSTSGTRRSADSARLPGKSQRAPSSASGTPRRSVPAVVAAAMRNELPSPRSATGSASTARRCASVGVPSSAVNAPPTASATG